MVGSVATREEEAIAKGLRGFTRGYRESFSSPDWAPDSKTLVYAQNAFGRNRNESRILLYDTATKQTTELLKTNAPIHGPLFSHDGQHLCFHAAGPSDAGYRVYNLAEQRFVFSDAVYSAGYAAYAKERSAEGLIAYTHCGVWIRDPATGDERLVFDELPNTHGLVWSPDGRFLLTLSGRPSRNPIHWLKACCLLCVGGHSIEYAYRPYAYDTRTGQTIRLRLNDRVREAFVLWQRTVPDSPVAPAK